MNFADIEGLWRSPQNRPTPGTLEREQQAMLAELRRRNRGTVVFFSLVGTVLAVVTGRFLWWLVSVSGSGRFNPTGEWGSLLLMALPWIALAIFIRRFRQLQRTHASSERSISACIQALLAENGAERARIKLIMILNTTLVLVVSLIVHQLRNVGKAGDEILIPAFVILPVIMFTLILALLRYDRRTLQPRRRELEQLLRTYEKA